MTENTAEHKEKNEISYHNKDVLSKTFGENLKNNRKVLDFEGTDCYNKSRSQNLQKISDLEETHE